MAVGPGSTLGSDHRPLPGNTGFESSRADIVYVQHWFEELKERVPLQ